MDAYETTQPTALVLSLMPELRSARPECRTTAILLIEAIGPKGSTPTGWPNLVQDIERRYGQATAREAERMAAELPIK